MATFELTAKHYMDMGPGQSFKQGDIVRIDVFKNNISANNLMVNPESRRAAIDQISMKGLDRNRVESHFHSGAWDVREVSSMSPLERMYGNSNVMPSSYLNSPWR